MSAAQVASCTANRSLATAASMLPSRDSQLLLLLLLLLFSCGHHSGAPRECTAMRPIEAGSLLGTAAPPDSSKRQNVQALTHVKHTCKVWQSAISACRRLVLLDDRQASSMQPCDARYGRCPHLLIIANTRHIHRFD
jgi:hypothetical protein